MTNKYVLSVVAVVASLLILLGVGIAQGGPGEADAQVGSGVGNYDIAGNVIVHGNVTVADGNDFTSSDDLVSTDDVTVGDDLNVTDQSNLAGAVVTSADVGNTAETTVTVTSGGTVTPLGRFTPLSSSGNVGTSAIAGCAAGDAYSEDIVLINMANTTITFTDTGTLKLSGNAALAQYDTLWLKCDNLHGNWIQIAPEGDN